MFECLSHPDRLGSSLSRCGLVQSEFAEEALSMELKRIDHKLTVCKVKDVSDINMDADFYFIGKTDEELS